jgi:Flp pilus assembly pilin Flp
MSKLKVFFGGSQVSLRALAAESGGQDMIEYSLLVAVMALGVVAALSGFQNVIGNVWGMISNNLSGSS